MSGAIFGKINLSHEVLDNKLADTMMEKLCVYRFDDKKTLTLKNVCMGCGIIHITKEDKNEILPYYDEVNKLFITADVILDNREELIKLLNIENRDITDSQLILKAYLKWKDDCAKYLLGDYAFVIFDSTNNNIICATDYVGCRTLYYKFENNSFSFSTVLEPIYEKEDINERWVSDFIAIPAVLHQSESEDTVYKGIYQLPAATVIIVNNQGLKKIKYWDPVKDCKKIKLKSDQEYVNEFKKVFTEAVRCKLRTSENIGISMSGGLDSTSVACVAASILKEQEKKLISFTSIPSDSYVDDKPNDRISNESSYVELIRKMYTNIDINYSRSEGKDTLTIIDTLLKVLEQPYKTYQNSFWSTEIKNRISHRGCKVLLTGQFGNYTISYGDFFTNMKTLLNEKKYIEFFKEIKGCSKLHNISSLYTLRYVLKAIDFSSLFLKEKYANKDKYIDEYLRKNPINKNLISKWKIKERFVKKGLIKDNFKKSDMYEERKIMAATWMFTQIATMETKLSLYYGIIQRDPTKDKRVIEFCFGLGGEQYVRNGLDRYLIRRAMKNIIPEDIRMLQGKKGFQGADWLERIKGKQNEIINLLEKCINCKDIAYYLDINYVKNQLDLLKKESIDNKSIDIKTVFISIILYKFFKIKSSDM